MKRVTMSFTDEKDLAILTGALRLALDEWGEMAGDEGDSGDDYWDGELHRASLLEGRVERARRRLNP